MSLLTISDVRARCIVDPATHCWHWQGALSSDGVPRIYTIDYERGDKRTMSGPLAVWHIAHNAPPLRGHLIYRGCQHRLCLNPAHLREARDRKVIGAHIRRLGSRVGTATESRRANIRLAMAATGVVPTPDDIVLAIRATPRAAATNHQLAQQHGLSEQTVSRIRRGETRRGVGELPMTGGLAA